MRRLVLEYYFVLRSVLKAKAHLRRSLTRCVHCGIFFLTDPRNGGRKDLRCPFGCREAHRRKRSTERSVAYNRSRGGRLKKKLRNGKRKGQRPRGSAPHEQPEQQTARAEERIEFDPKVVEYVRVVVSLLEGRRVSRDEILEMLRRTVRQRSFARERRIDYVLRSLKEDPP